MTINRSIIGEMADELLIDAAALTGGWDLIGTLEENPVHIIFDNQSGDTDIEIGNNASTTWKTFVAGEALVLDMRGNHGIAANFSFRKGMNLYARGAAGTGNFSISYTFAVDL